MAGAGYKLFNTGDVLTAAQVNTYLQEQTVMVFANSTARTTALSGVLAEGMVTYLKDTDTMEMYNGSSWVSIAADQTPLTTKGDLFTYTTADARLAVGNNGETLLADSSTSTGLRWGANLGFTAGKNKIINGDYRINQRGFSSTTSTGVYMFDRWITAVGGDGTTTYSAQTFTAGTAPVAGYEGINYQRIVTASQTNASVASITYQPIEDVRTLANQTVTYSFWAKANSGTPKIALNLIQNFGSGGSADVNNYLSQVTLSTSWTRYSVTFSMPSVSGKTIGSSSWVGILLWVSAGSSSNTPTGSLGIQSNTFELWGHQLESGSVATPFQTATGTIQGELAACQRYYSRITIVDSYGRLGFGTGKSTTKAVILCSLPIKMRAAITAIDYSSLAIDPEGAAFSVTALTLSTGSPQTPVVEATVASGLTQYRPYFLEGDNNASAYVGFSAEL